MKKQTRITLIALITILILVVLGGTIYFYVQKYAYADFDDLTSDYVVNFNQIVNYSQTSSTAVSFSVDHFKLNGTFVANDWIFTNIYANLDNTHKYYFYVKQDEPTIEVVFDSTQLRNNVTYIGQPTQSIQSPLYFKTTNAGTYNNYNIYFYCIDLTMMFGSDNIPSLEQCQSYFLSDYYAYNTGTPMPFSVSYLDGYVNGVNDTLGIFTYKLITESIQSSMQGVNYNNYYGEITAYQNYVRITGQSDKVTAGYMPLLATIETGTHFKISGGFSHNDGHNNLPITIAYLGSNGVMIEIQTKKVSGGSNTPISFEFDAPSNINGFYILFDDDISSPSIFIYKFECEILIKDVYALVETAYQNGYGKAKNDYLPGNTGYNEIFNAGKQYAITHNQNNAWGSAWDFIESAFTGIGSIFSIQLLPGVPLSIFILVPLMISLIFFIVKLVKGGG